MKHTLLLSFSLFILLISSGQTIIRDTICGTDTMIISHHRMLMVRDTIPFRAFSCRQVSRSAVRVEMGFNYISYRGKTSQWLASHEAFMLGLGVEINHVVE